MTLFRAADAAMNRLGNLCETQVSSDDSGKRQFSFKRGRMLLTITHVLFLPTVMGTLSSPLRHGQSGILDEVLLFGAPLIVTVLILVISSKRARSQKERVRVRSEESANLEAPNEGDSHQTVQSEEAEAPHPAEHDNR